MKPSDHLAAGECPYCGATGEVVSIVRLSELAAERGVDVLEVPDEDALKVCALCHGSKKWPPPLEDASHALAEHLVGEWHDMRPGDGPIESLMKLTRGEYALYVEHNVLPDDYLDRHDVH